MQDAAAARLGEGSRDAHPHARTPQAAPPHRPARRHGQQEQQESAQRREDPSRRSRPSRGCAVKHTESAPVGPPPANGPPAPRARSLVVRGERGVELPLLDVRIGQLVEAKEQPQRLRAHGGRRRVGVDTLAPVTFPHAPLRMSPRVDATRGAVVTAPWRTSVPSRRFLKYVCGTPLRQSLRLITALPSRSVFAPSADWSHTSITTCAHALVSSKSKQSSHSTDGPAPAAEHFLVRRHVSSATVTVANGWQGVPSGRTGRSFASSTRMRKLPGRWSSSLSGCTALCPARSMGRS